MDIDFINECMAYYYNQCHGKEPELKKGDKVYLLQKNIQTDHPNKKLDFKKLGPYKVITRKNQLNYEIEIQDNKNLENRFEQRYDMFIEDPSNEVLKDHQLSGKLQGFRAFSITGDIRVVCVGPDDSIGHGHRAARVQHTASGVVCYRHACQAGRPREVVYSAS